MLSKPELELLVALQIPLPMDQEGIKTKIAATQHYNQMKRAAFQNALNLRMIPNTHHADYYLTPQAKKLKRWAHLLEQRPPKPLQRSTKDTTQLKPQESFVEEDFESSNPTPVTDIAVVARRPQVVSLDRLDYKLAF